MGDRAPSAPRRSAVALGVALVALAALVVAWPTRNAHFLSGDDERLILNHVLVNHPSLENAWTLLTNVTDDLYQPLPMISFQLNYWLAGPDPAGRFPVSAYGFHLTNIALHMLNAALVFLLARRVARCSRVGLITGLFFAFHPFAIEPVAWINGRMILMATAFSLLALLACLRDRPALPVAATILAWLGALLSKVMPTVPIVAAWWRWNLQGKRTRRDVVLFAVLLAMGVAATALAASSTQNFVGSDAGVANSVTSSSTKTLLAFRYYLENYVLPNRLAAWSPPPRSISIVSKSCLIAMGEAAGLVALMLLARRVNRTAWLGLGAFLLLILPFLVAGTTRHFLAADRYMYLPAVGLHLAISAFLVQVMDAPRTQFGKYLSFLSITETAAFLLMMGVTFSWRYDEMWTDTISRDKHIADLYHDEPDAWSYWAKACIFDGKSETALQIVLAARRRWPDNARLAAAAGDAYRAKRDWPAAERELRFASERMPEHLRTNYEYALTLEQLGRRADAMARYRKIIELNPGYLPAITALARCELAEGHEEASFRLSEKALTINPDNVESLRRLAGILMSRKEDARALNLLERAHRIDPSDVTANEWLHILLVEAARGNETAQLWLPLLRSGDRSDEIQSWFNWAWYYAPTEESSKFLHGVCATCDFARWAFAVQSLVDGNEAAVVQLDEICVLRRPFLTHAPEKCRLIVSTLERLPDHIKTSAAVGYLVARAYMVGGDSSAARQVAQQVVNSGVDGRWQQAARNLLDELPPTSQSAPH